MEQGPVVPKLGVHVQQQLQLFWLLSSRPFPGLSPLFCSQRFQREMCDQLGDLLRESY